MLDVDVPQKIVDFVLKFPPNQKIFLHRHLALTNTLVVQGEHRLYEPNGQLKEVRPVGSYTSSPPGYPHQEGAGDEGGVVFYSVRGKDGKELYSGLVSAGSTQRVEGEAPFKVTVGNVKGGESLSVDDEPVDAKRYSSARGNVARLSLP